jgi:hypothetical protein
MPITRMSEAPPNLRELEGVALTVSQVNWILARYDELEGKPGIENPMAVAINEFKGRFAVQGGDWVEKAADWRCGAARDLPIVQRATWDGSAAKGRIFAWAGFGGDDPSPAKARRAFLVYDASAPELKGSYKLPIADVMNGRLIVPTPALGAAASRLPQTNAPDRVLARAQSVLDGYYDKLKKSRPTTSDVHRPAAMTVSGSAADGWVRHEKAWRAELVKADEERRLVYGVVLKPDEFDSQDDRAKPLEIEKAAHGFMRKSRVMDRQHREALPQDKAVPVESYLAPADFEMNGREVKKGSWVLVTHVPDDDLWELVKSGKLCAYSIRGWGKRRPVS